ncbi:MAG: hypothetical protein IKX13_02435 [Bacteroidales bacterium]|nr:hypothetical protein [Bacteroidales bacterium]
MSLQKKIRPYVLPAAILLGVLLHRWIGILNFLTPYLIFSILLLTFCAADIRHLRPSKLEGWIVLFQLAASTGGYAAIRLLTGNELLAEGLLVGILCPVAASVSVVACALGADRQTVVSYTMVGNLTVACAAPIIFSFIGQRQSMPFWESFTIIFMRIASVLAIPFIVAWLLQKCWPSANRRIARYKGAAFYLWAAALLLTLGKTIDYIFLEGGGNGRNILYLGILSLLMCVVQFAVGKRIGKHYGDTAAGGQMLAQKNSAMGIWMANMYLLPLAAVYVAFHSIWQNLYNSWQLWRYPRQQEKKRTDFQTTANKIT